MAEHSDSRRAVSLYPCVALLAATLIAAQAHAAWMDGAWKFRRAVDVEWPAQNAGGDELAMARFFANGKQMVDGQDIRVTAEETAPTPFRILGVGPGDRVSVMFQLKKGVKRYYIYWGNEKAPASKKDEIEPRCGLYWEMHRWPGGGLANFKEMETAWDKRGDLIGCTLIDRLFCGVQPFGEQQQTISKLTGAVFAPLDGSYTFAAAADDKAALYIDGKPLVFAHGLVGDTRFNGKVDLRRGKHDIVLYHVNAGADMRFSVGWKRPDQQKFEVIPAESFGLPGKVTIGPAEQYLKTFIADARIDYAAESFVDNHYTHRYKFAGLNAKPELRLTWEWDFGDGQSAKGAEVEHVYLADGEYAVKVTARTGSNSDTQQMRLVVSRQWDRLDNPPFDPPVVQARIVEAYDAARLPVAHLPWAAALLARTDRGQAAMKVALRLASEKSGVDADASFNLLRDFSDKLLAGGAPEDAARLWAVVPADSPLQPRAALQQARVMLWYTAQFPEALKVVEPVAQSRKDDPNAQAFYAQALILNQKADDGRKVLASLKPQDTPERQAVLAGALARTIEFYITEGDWETGEESWDRWQKLYPSDFLEGYSVLLKMKLMELRKRPAEAARLAEAFSSSVPASSYAPQLLDRASKLLATSDPAKSKALRQTLKTKYPEDPLSQGD